MGSRSLLAERRAFQTLLKGLRDPKKMPGCEIAKGWAEPESRAKYFRFGRWIAGPSLAVGNVPPRVKVQCLCRLIGNRPENFTQICVSTSSVEASDPGAARVLRTLLCSLRFVDQRRFSTHLARLVEGLNRSHDFGEEAPLLGPFSEVMWARAWGTQLGVRPYIEQTWLAIENHYIKCPDIRNVELWTCPNALTWAPRITALPGITLANIMYGLQDRGSPDYPERLGKVIEAWPKACASDWDSGIPDSLDRVGDFASIARCLCGIPDKALERLITAYGNERILEPLWGLLQYQLDCCGKDLPLVLLNLTVGGGSGNVRH